MRRVVTVAVLLSIALLLVASASEAARNPTKTEKHKIRPVLDRNGVSCSAWPGLRCHRKIKISTKRQTWAAAYITGRQVQGDVASLHRKHHKWRVHQIGNGGGCGVPSKVRADLKLACY